MLSKEGWWIFKEEMAIVVCSLQNNVIGNIAVLAAVVTYMKRHYPELNVVSMCVQYNM